MHETNLVKFYANAFLICFVLYFKQFVAQETQYVSVTPGNRGTQSTASVTAYHDTIDNSSTLIQSASDIASSPTVQLDMQAEPTATVLSVPSASDVPQADDPTATGEQPSVEQESATANIHLTQQSSTMESRTAAVESNANDLEGTSFVHPSYATSFATASRGREKREVPASSTMGSLVITPSPSYESRTVSNSRSTRTVYICSTTVKVLDLIDLVFTVTRNLSPGASASSLEGGYSSTHASISYTNAPDTATVDARTVDLLLSTSGSESSSSREETSPVQSDSLGTMVPITQSFQQFVTMQSNANNSELPVIVTANNPLARSIPTNQTSASVASVTSGYETYDAIDSNRSTDAIQTIQGGLATFTDMDTHMTTAFIHTSMANPMVTTAPLYSNTSTLVNKTVIGATSTAGPIPDQITEHVITIYTCFADVATTSSVAPPYITPSSSMPDLVSIVSSSNYTMGNYTILPTEKPKDLAGLGIMIGIFAGMITSFILTIIFTIQHKKALAVVVHWSEKEFEEDEV